MRAPQPGGAELARIMHWGRRVAVVAVGVVQRANTTATVYVDPSGVGTPVVDELRDAGVKARMWARYFTHGDRRTVEPKRSEVKLRNG